MIVTDKLPDLLEQIIIRGFESDFYSIALYCGRLARFDPERGLKTYFEKVSEQRKASIQAGTSLARPEHSGRYFNLVLPIAFENDPSVTLELCRDFLEHSFSSTALHSEELLLSDRPSILLYGEYQPQDMAAVFDWFRLNFLEYCQTNATTSSTLIERLRSSKWQTLIQLAYLGMLKQPHLYKTKLYNRTMKIIKSKQNSAELYLLFRIFEAGFAAFNERQREQILEQLLKCPQEEGSQEEKVWLYAPINHIPDQFRSTQIREKLDKLKKYLGDYKYVPPFRISEVHTISSPVPKTSLAEMSNDDLYEFLIQNRELKETWSSDTLATIGGVEELSREVSTLFVEQLDKYKSVLTKLSTDPRNFIYLNSCLPALPIDTAVADWFVDLSLRVYKSDELELSLGRALYKAVPILSYKQWEALKQVALHLMKSSDPDKDTFKEYQKQGYSNDAVTDGINSTRGEVCGVLILVMGRFPDSDVEAALSKLAGDNTISVRATLIYYLPLALSACGWDRCFSLFQKAFDPTEPAFMEVAVQFLRYVPNNKLKEVLPMLQAMQKTENGSIAEAAAVLTALYAIKGLLPKQDLYAVLLNVNYVKSARIKAVELVVGALRSEDYFQECVDILWKVLEIESDDLLSPLCRIFMDARPTDLLKLKDLIQRLLERIPWGELFYWLVQYLEKAATIYPREAFEILEWIIPLAEEIDYSKGYIPPTHSKAPLGIINLILDVCPDLEERALNMLDKLITLRWSGVDEFLKMVEHS